MCRVSIETELGKIEVLFSEKGIRCLLLPGTFDCNNRQNPGDKQNGLLPEYLPELREQLVDYSKGHAITADFPLDLSGTSVFCRKVWQIAQEIPFGETRSYRWVACKTGNASSARAVGGALARNPVPVLIPCHRVIKSDGTPGGFAGKMSCVSIKVNLLSLEGHIFK